MTSESFVYGQLDMPKKKLRKATGRNTTWGVFKAYAVSFCVMFRVYNLLMNDRNFTYGRYLFRGGEAMIEHLVLWREQDES